MTRNLFNNPARSSPAAQRALSIERQKNNNNNSKNKNSSHGRVSTISVQSSIRDEPLEMTHEQYLRHVRKGDRVGNTLINSSTRARSYESSIRNNRKQVANHDDFSYNTENKTINSAQYTVESKETVKASNTTDKSVSSSKKNGWNTLKKIVGMKSQSEGTNKSIEDRTGSSGLKMGHRRVRSRSEDSMDVLKQGRRIRSTPGDIIDGNSNDNETQCLTTQQQRMMDDSIRARFDGIDIEHLGGAKFYIPIQKSSTTQNNNNNQQQQSQKRKPWDMPLDFTFTGKPISSTPENIISQMLRCSAGQETPEILLEGALPGPDFRWIVRMTESNDGNNKSSNNKQQNDNTNIAHLRWCNVGEPMSKISDVFECKNNDCKDSKSKNSSTIKKKDSVEEEEEDTASLWGSDPAPADLATMEAFRKNIRDDEEFIVDMAARSSIPIDIDDDSFMIMNIGHVKAIHDLVALGLSKNRIGVALTLFQRMLEGLDVTSDEMKFVKGATLHNIGIMHMWLNQYDKALASFCKSLDERKKTLPAHHIDHTVTKMRIVSCLLVSFRFDDAVKSCNDVIERLRDDHIIKAKVLNNLAVALYFQGKTTEALAKFTEALEIQRFWLNKLPVRRDCIVFEVAVTLSNMGKLHLERNDGGMARELYEEALMLLTSSTVLRKDHNMVLACLSSLAVAKAHTGELDKAIHILNGVLRSQNNRFGHLSADSIDTIGLLGIIKAKNGDYDGSLNCLSTVKKWQEKNLKKSHASFNRIQECIKALQTQLGGSAIISKVWI